MAIRETLLLDIAEAQRQVDALEAQLDALSAPISIPVNIESDQALADFRRQIAAADADNIDVDVDVDGVQQAATQFSRLEDEVEDTETDLRRLERAADNSGDAILRVGTRGTSAFTSLRGSLGGVLTGFAAIAAARGLITFFGDAIEGASNLDESLSKSSVVFGDFASQIEDFARTGPEALGLSTQAALEMAGTFGNLFTALGLTQDAAADLAPEIVRLGADLASFNNIPVEDALEKLRAGLVGEVEPLRTVGVALNAASVEAKALELGLAGTNGEISEAAKVQARYALILEQTTNAQGDFARTADGIANTQRTLAAEFENARSSLGQALNPLYRALLDIVPLVIEGIERLTPAIAAMSQGFADAASGTDGFITGLGRVAAAAPGVASVLGDGVGSITDLGQGFQSFLAGDIEGAFNQIRDSIEGVGDAVDTLNFNQIQDTLIQDLNSGIAPARALELALTQLNEQGFDTDQITAYAAALANVAGVDAGDLLDIIDNVEAFGLQAGLTTEEVDALVAGLSLLFTRPSGQSLAEEKEDLRTFGSAASEATSETLAQADALRLLEAAARTSGVPLSELVGNVSALPPELQELASSLDPVTLEFIQAADRVDGFKAAIGELPGALEAAGRAFEDESGEIEKDFSDFLDNLADELQQQRAFQTNLDILRSFGLDQLAATFEAQGLEAAGLLADAVANPAEAAQAEALLDQQYTGVAQSLIDTMAGVIEGDITVSNALLGLVSAAQTQLDQNPLIVPVEVESIVIPPNLVEGTGAGGTVTAPPNLVQSASGLTVEQNFYSVPSPTTDTARAAQTAAAVLAAKAK